MPSEFKNQKIDSATGNQTDSLCQTIMAIKVTAVNLDDSSSAIRSWNFADPTEPKVPWQSC